MELPDWLQVGKTVMLSRIVVRSTWDPKRKIKTDKSFEIRQPVQFLGIDGFNQARISVRTTVGREERKVSIHQLSQCSEPLDENGDPFPSTEHRFEKG